ncbi:transcriptional regulator [Amycolatopsis sp. WAC 04182]|uniref:helix-turn-helix domain-containing protein n=1 Tax=Amycolatopsis sp. WAC 04182 TaxID=2203198 RepID=UPI000F79FC75|nr:helix-turn-helix domain-containing protein [Amycolatopsis sp. WAC 04182]RSN56448.1 transcriptional regulator [Amycolatopsis sp. WAC 04182]
MTEPRATTLTDRIDRLFQVVRRAGGDQHSHEEVARACRESTGESFSAAYLWQLRTGRRDNPTKRHLEALAAFFQVPPAYFFDDEQGRALAEEVELLGALRNTAVRNLALRAVTLSEEGLGTVSDIVEAIKRREAMRDQGE